MNKTDWFICTGPFTLDQCNIECCHITAIYHWAIWHADCLVIYFYVGGAYDDAHMPNSPHRNHTPTIDMRDFCSQLINFIHFGIPFKVVVIVGIANWLRLVKKFIEKIFRIGQFSKIFGSFNDMRHLISKSFLPIL